LSTFFGGPGVPSEFFRTRAAHGISAPSNIHIYSSSVKRKIGPGGEKQEIRDKLDWRGLAIFLGKFVILSAAKNLAKITKILRCAQNDRLARIPCHIRLAAALSFPRQDAMLWME
jgi:hypothetical protein